MSRKTPGPAAAKPPAIVSLMPEQGRVLLTGTGKQFVERIGVEAIRNITLAVLLGENVRDRTEPLTRQRITLLSGAILMLMLKGWSTVDDFDLRMTGLAIDDLTTSRRGNAKADLLPAQWLLGLTDKQVQNVLRDSQTNLRSYAKEFEGAINTAVEQFTKDYGELHLSLGVGDGSSQTEVQIGWREFARLATAIGSQTLSVRGSDKSMYGKLFEKLILGSILTILGCQRADSRNLRKTIKVFWLSDSSGSRESDATLLYRPGKMARFDIGFIGRGNSEISKDKLSRYEREAEAGGALHESVTFILVDTLPAKSDKTQAAANRIGAEIIQMNWQQWPRILAQRLQARLGFEHELATMPENQVKAYLTKHMASMPVEDFLSALSINAMAEAAEAEGEAADGPFDLDE